MPERLVEEHTGLPRELDSDAIYGGRTHLVERRLTDHESFNPPAPDAPHGRFAGRRIIGSDTRIEGGVYLGAGAREAIVVDNERHGDLEPVYKRLLQEVTVGNHLRKDRVLQGVFKLVQDVLPYDGDKVDRLQELIPPDERISLGWFVGDGTNGFGVCRHQALLAGWLLERLRDDGHIRGRVSVKRNQVPGYGAHAWAEYETFSGHVYVIDPAQSYVGRKEDARSDPRRWRY